MKTIYSEKQYQQDIIKEFAKNGILERSAKNYDKDLAIDKEIVLEFLKATQEKELKELNLNDGEIIESINKNIIDNGILFCLKNGIYINNKHFELVYNKEASGFNEDLVQKYEQNKITLMQEVNADNENTERVDLVIFINGLAFACLELKSNSSGQNIDFVKEQYKKRNSNTRLFNFKKGAIVFFGLDLNECIMTTELKTMETKFLPFNKGKSNGEGAGNDIIKNNSYVWYLWEEVLTKDNIINLIKNFIFEDDGKMIFPRYHQMDLINKIKKDILNSNEYKNYLIQHSAGSGKTKSIAWLSFMLASLYKNGSICYEKIIIATDRKVVDKQLQDEIKKLKHEEGFIKALGDDNTSSDLKDALRSNTRIIITTIQKFLYIKDELRDFETKCAVIIDEAHSSTSGEDMDSILETLSATFESKKGNKQVKNIAHNKPKIISLFGFTATPKYSTLQIFGQKDRNKNGFYVPFHLYSMKQAIEENYILNVLKNYITYDTYCTLILKGKDIEISQKSKAIKEIKGLINNNDNVIKQRIYIIAEHFANTGSKLLKGKSKAMVVCEDIESVIKHYYIFKDYCKDKKYDFKPLIAFSGEKELDIGHGIQKFSETFINGVSENSLPSEFDKDERRVLFVANKYQTGFDQNKLCIMYVLKSLNGIAAVQTLSRLNRIYIYPKDTFILDFVNEYKNIKKSFKPYYMDTLLEEKDEININNLIDLYDEIDRFNILEKEKESDFVKNKNRDYITEIINEINELENNSNFKILLNKYLNYFLLLKIVGYKFTDEFSNRYIFLSCLKKELINGSNTEKIDIENIIDITDIKTGEATIIYEEEQIKNKFSLGRLTVREEKFIKLSKILEQINNDLKLKMEKNLQIQAIEKIINELLNNNKLKTGADNNEFDDFKRIYNDEVSNTITDNYEDEQYTNLYEKLLNNDNYRGEIFMPFCDDIYKQIKK